MTKERKEIILQEIQYWKANRLLPESYCDYLLALYTQGEGLNQPLSGSSQWMIVTRVMIAFLMLLISFLVIYFTETAFIMQTGILSIFVLGTGLTAVYLYNKKSIDFSVYVIIGLLLLLLWNVHIISIWQAPNWLFASIVMVHCLLWYWGGRKLDVIFIKIIGTLGSASAFIYMFFNF
ncbi:hypothetical protein FHS45_002783 [Thalassobacillus devorans]|uniref:hypothetical protein n=1 Tax=Thalassobacillus devorans TaxID=279813 RepID=UPI000782637D|nr:hypothetical protein [Thalassobacillus devorans]NIK29678.1 hypothetical protein [Thalassobacillus devorans]